MKLFVSIVFVCFAFSDLHSQSCGFSPVAYSASYDLWYQNASSELLNNAKRSKSTYDSVIRIPVIFHVIYPRYNEVTYDDVIWMLNELNNDFRRRNADTIRTREIFKDRVVDTRIEFYMAETDPVGNPCTGYESKLSNNYYGVNPSLPYSSWHPMKFDSLKGFDAWDTKRYLNIWVCNLIAPDGNRYWAGFSTSPPGAKNWNSKYWGDSLIDGVVMHCDYFRYRNNSSTFTHEVGHYLGLRHVSGDPVTIIPDSCAYDDGIFDTPKINGANYFTCDFSINSCTEKNDLPDMLENFMDYSDDQCRNSFTFGQSQLMHKCVVELRPKVFSYKINRTLIDTLYALKIMPNPNSGKFNIQNDNDEIFTAEVYDFNGRIVGTMKIENGLNEFGMDLVTGNYYIVFKESDNKIVCTKNLILIN